MKPIIKKIATFMLSLIALVFLLILFYMIYQLFIDKPIVEGSLKIFVCLMGIIIPIMGIVWINDN